MKTAVSIPAPIFTAAERMARRLRIPRSQLYAKALEAYVRTHHAEDMTAALNAVYKDEDSQLDPVIAELQAVSLDREEW